MASDANNANAQNAANVDAEHREATEYWGYLIKPDKCGTELFDRLLKGIAEVIVSGFSQDALIEPHTCFFQRTVY